MAHQTWPTNNWYRRRKGIAPARPDFRPGFRTGCWPGCGTWLLDFFGHINGNSKRTSSKLFMKCFCVFTYSSASPFKQIQSDLSLFVPSTVYPYIDLHVYFLQCLLLRLLSSYSVYGIFFVQPVMTLTQPKMLSPLKWTKTKKNTFFVLCFFIFLFFYICFTVFHWKTHLQLRLRPRTQPKMLSPLKWEIRRALGPERVRQPTSQLINPTTHQFIGSTHQPINSSINRLTYQCINVLMC